MTSDDNLRKFNFFLISECNSLFCFMNKHTNTFLHHFVSIKKIIAFFSHFTDPCLTFGSDYIISLKKFCFAEMPHKLSRYNLQDSMDS